MNKFSRHSLVCRRVRSSQVRLFTRNLAKIVSAAMALLDCVSSLMMQSMPGVRQKIDVLPGVWPASTVHVTLRRAETLVKDPVLELQWSHSSDCQNAMSVIDIVYKVWDRTHVESGGSASGLNTAGSYTRYQKAGDMPSFKISSNLVAISKTPR